MGRAAPARSPEAMMGGWRRFIGSYVQLLSVQGLWDHLLTEDDGCRGLGIDESGSLLQLAQEIGTAHIQAHRSGSGHAAFFQRQLASIDDEGDWLPLNEKDGP